MKKLVVLLLMTPASAFALNFTSAAKGTSSADFLEMGVGARGVALGEAYSALADDASALYWNPAALTNVEKRSVTLMHAAGLGSSYFDYGAYAQSLGEYGAAAASYQYLSEGTVVQTDDVTGNDVGTFSPDSLALTFGYAYRFRDLAGLGALDGYSVGVAGKVIQEKIATTDTTGAVDFGILSRPYFGKRLRLALTAANIGGRLKFDQEASRLPLVFKAGSALKLTDRWSATMDAGFPSDNQPFIGLGSEYVQPVSRDVGVAGRLGFNSRTVGDVSGFNAVSMGVGIGFRWLSVDYAFLPFGSIGNVHRFSVSAKF